MIQQFVSIVTPRTDRNRTFDGNGIPINLVLVGITAPIVQRDTDLGPGGHLRTGGVAADQIFETASPMRPTRIGPQTNLDRREYRTFT